MIKIEYGRSYSDQTFEYKIKIQKPMTVGEFIKEWMTTRPDDWGYFGIYDRDRGTIFGNPKCEYSDGKIITDPIPDEYLNAEINEVTGSGGWTRSDFLFKISTRRWRRKRMVDEIFCPNTFDEYLNNTTGASSSQSYGAKLVPVKQWERDCFGSYCSCCGFYAYRDRFGQPIESKFCPNCGEELRRE